MTKQHNNVRRLLAGFGLMAASLQVSAHDFYLWPSYFTVNSEKPTHVAVDLTASHTTFRPDFSLPSRGLKVFGVDGKQVRNTGAFFEGNRRSTFDLAVSEEGTYKLLYQSTPSYFSRYTIGKRNTEKHVRANKKEVASKVPKGAKDIQTAAYYTTAISFLTNKAPSEAVFEPTNKGFEVVPVTHPADYVTGEELTVSLLFNGEPVKDLTVELELEGPQYREEPVALELKSDSKGLVNFELEHGGRYMFKVNHKRKSDDDLSDFVISRVYYAFEVIYE